MSVIFKRLYALINHRVQKLGEIYAPEVSLVTAYRLPVVDEPVPGISHFSDAGDHFVGNIPVVLHFVAAIKIEKGRLSIKAFLTEI